MWGGEVEKKLTFFGLATGGEKYEEKGIHFVCVKINKKFLLFFPPPPPPSPLLSVDCSVVLTREMPAGGGG